MTTDDDNFPSISFSGELRPSQQEVAEIATAKFSTGAKKIHIVAPPGSGKTVIGLYLWAELIKKPCLVLSPNSAIQSQWASRVDLFEFEGSRSDVVSTNPESPSLLTSLTYQSVTLPARNNESTNDAAIQAWTEKLIEEGEVASTAEARLWIQGLQKNNPAYYGKRLKSYSKKVRDELSMQGESVSLLHSSAIETLRKLANVPIGVIILDECHHLVEHWGRVLADAMPMLNDPIIIGLTATPPDIDNKDSRDVERYQSFFGPVDFQVPVPAVVKDGFLAPYQDLAYFVRPTKQELDFVASADQRLNELVESLCETNEPIAPRENQISEEPATELYSESSSLNLTRWLYETVSSLRLPASQPKNWGDFEKRDPAFALAARQFLHHRGQSLPTNAPQLLPFEKDPEIPEMEYWVPVLDRYVRHHLRRSGESRLQNLGEEIVASLRLLGVQITETGTRACSSPVSRVLAYSNSKSASLVPILIQEIESLGDSIRAVVVTDFERSSAVTTELAELMNEETGGAVAAFKALLSNNETDDLEPILVTGSTILIDDEIEDAFLTQSRTWLSARNLKVELLSESVLDFREIKGKGPDWSPRVYIQLVTELFQKGLTKCLVGTRGLLGEGWDANKINVLVDLTTVTTSMSINQLRGRSFRLDPDCPEKLANNWDVVCIAPEFKKGFDDYARFKRKHQNLFGVTDDGAIEKGVGHVHPAFTELKPEGLENSISVMNAEMLERSLARDHSRSLWEIGKPFSAVPVAALEIKPKSEFGRFPPFKGATVEWSTETLTRAISTAVLRSLIKTGLIKSNPELREGELPGGYLRVFVKDSEDEESNLFASSLKDVFGPIENARYVVERIVEERTQSLISMLLPEVLGRYFYRSERKLAMLHAVPTELARNKERVNVFLGHWNELVSPGKAWYTQRGEGKEQLEKAILANQIPNASLHNKEIFL